MRRALVALTLCVPATLVWFPVTGAGAANPAIGPNQAFVGTVNGSTGQQQPAPVRVACPGPQRAGETTHPLAHQRLVVVRAASTNPNAGSTGDHGDRVSTYLGIRPGAPTHGTPASTTRSASMPTFTRYGAPQPIPTSITVPCSGKGYITFMPWPREPGRARAFVVSIEYVNIAV